MVFHACKSQVESTIASGESPTDVAKRVSEAYYQRSSHHFPYDDCYEFMQDTAFFAALCQEDAHSLSRGKSTSADVMVRPKGTKRCKVEAANDRLIDRIVERRKAASPGKSPLPLAVCLPLFVFAQR